MFKKFGRLLQPESENNLLSREFNLFIIGMIILNVVAVMLETISSLYQSYSGFFHFFEISSVIIFTIEYGLRVGTCTSIDRFKEPIAGRIKYMVTPLALVDLLSILPFYLPGIIPFDLRFFRALRLFRVFALLRMKRYSESLQMLFRVAQEKREPLIITFSATMVLLMISSSIIYFLEHEVQPNVFSSIPESFWWSIGTMTRLGIGSVVPITFWGKFFGGVVAFLGLGVFALPTGIIASGFLEEIQKNRKVGTFCPLCGKPQGGP